MFTWDSINEPARGQTRARRPENGLSGFVLSVDRLFYAAAAAFAVCIVVLIVG